MADFPRCVVCRTKIAVGQNVVFRTDGRVQHPECPKVTCAVCSLPILPTHPIRRQGEDEEQQVHANCWLRLQRTPPR